MAEPRVVKASSWFRTDEGPACVVKLEDSSFAAVIGDVDARTRGTLPIKIDPSRGRIERCTDLADLEEWLIDWVEEHEARDDQAAADEIRVAWREFRDKPDADLTSRFIPV